MKCLLTKSTIEQALNAQVRTQLWDTLITGLYVEVRRSGKGSFMLRHTHPKHGKQTLTLGPVNILKIEEARAKAKELLAHAYLGNDIALRKKQSRAGLSFHTVIRDYYLPHIQTYKKSAQTDRSVLNHHILPVLGTLTLTEITAVDITQVKQRMLEKGLAHGTCNRALVLCRFVFNLAIKQWRLPGISQNPANDVPLFKLNNHQQTFLSADQLHALLSATRECPLNPLLPAIIALLSLTGVRKRNALDAQWREFDFPRQSWTIPMTKSGKPQTIYLSPEALALLEALPSKGQSPYVFPNPKTGQPFTSVFASWNTARQKAGMPHVRIHDLRHTFASLLINAGHSLYVVQKALGHHNPSVTLRYAHLADDVLRQANNAVGRLVGDVALLS